MPGSENDINKLRENFADNRLHSQKPKLISKAALARRGKGRSPTFCSDEFPTESRSVSGTGEIGGRFRLFPDFPLSFGRRFPLRSGRGGFQGGGDGEGKSYGLPSRQKSCQHRSRRVRKGARTSSATLRRRTPA